MRFYGLSYWEVLKLPIRVFWAMDENVTRIRSEEDLRSFRVANNAQGGEQSEEYIDGLAKSVGNVFVIDRGKAALMEGVDKQGLDELRSLGNLMTTG